MVVNRQLKIQEFQKALKNVTKDPFGLAKVIIVKPPSNEQSLLSNNNNNNNNNQLSSNTITDEYNTDWSHIISSWLDALDASDSGNAMKCYEYQSTLHSQFNQLFASSNGNYLVPTLHSVCKSTKYTAIAADRNTNNNNNENQNQSNQHVKLHNAVTLLQESFSRTYNDRKELRAIQSFDENLIYDNYDGSKKIGVIGIVNILFSIYFQLNTLRLCKNLVKPIEAKKLHLEITGGTNVGQLVTYKYYTGRLYLFEDLYLESEQNLTYAYHYAKNNAISNKRRILRYLIPVKLYRGKFPTNALLERYKLVEYIALVDSMRKGDFKTFNAALIDYQHRFIRQGTYLLLEKCKTVCYRNLFKRIHYSNNNFDNAGQIYQISLQQVRTVFHWLDMIIDLDEIECILANLIYRGYVRGYLSHSKRVLVLSKRDPFPLSAVIAK